MTLAENNNRFGPSGGTQLASISVEDQRMTQSLVMRRILVAIDFSSSSTLALRYAVMLAERFDATLHLCHVVESEYSFGEHILLFEGQSDADRLLRSKDRLIALGQEEVPPLIPTYPHVRFGKAARELNSLASELKCDLVVLGTRGYSGWQSVILGSTAQNVTSYGSCAVLVVRDAQAGPSSNEEIETNLSEREKSYEN